MGDRRLRYGSRTKEILGSGSFGTVYKVDCPPDVPYAAEHPLVAMKEISQVPQ